MQLLGSVVNIIVFTSMTGGLCAVLILFVQKVMRLSIPLWVGMLGAAFFLVPITTSTVVLIPPEETMWVSGYQIACTIWVAGVGICLVCHVLSWLLACLAVRRYPVCDDERIRGVYSKCIHKLGVTARAPLLFGTLKEPACVATLPRPAIILNKEIVSRLSDEELQIVLCHELMHISRRHHVMRGVYDVVTALHWFNPIAWIAKYEFFHICETDCDRQTLKSIKTTTRDYSLVLLRLMELSHARTAHSSRLGIMDFLAAKQRFTAIVQRPSKARMVVVSLLLSLALVATVTFSLSISQEMFYPYPASWGEGYEQVEG